MFPAGVDERSAGVVAAKTIRQGNLGKRVLRLVEKVGKFYGLADGKVCVEGSDADRVWQQLHDEAGKFDPKYFGYSYQQHYALTCAHSLRA
jgi:hypothetical protein